MSSAARRLALTLIACATLVAPAVAAGSADAASRAPAADRTVLYRGSDVSFHAFGHFPGYPGNAHAVYLNVEHDSDGTRIVDGWIWDFRCGPGQTINGLGYGDEDESDCTMVRALDIDPHGVRLRQPTGNVDHASLGGSVALIDTAGTRVRAEPINLELAGVGPTSRSDSWVDGTHVDFVRTYQRQATVTGTFGSLVVTGAPSQEIRSDVWRSVLFDR